MFSSLFTLISLLGANFSLYLCREWGWEIFQSIEKYCKTQYGYGHVSDVEEVDGSPTDQMESFFLGELMKYLYLLMDPDSEVDLDKVRKLS